MVVVECDVQSRGVARDEAVAAAEQAIAAALAARWPSARVVAVDSAPAMLEALGNRAGAARIERLCADAVALPLPDGAFDLVFSNLMLPWCEDVDAVVAVLASTPDAMIGPEQAIRDLLPALRENRPYVVTHVPNRPHVEARFRALLDAFDRAAEA